MEVATWQKVMIGAENLMHVVEVKIKGGMYTRPVVKLYRLDGHADSVESD